MDRIREVTAQIEQSEEQLLNARSTEVRVTGDVPADIVRRRHAGMGSMT
jgi:hypothetical protein